MSTKATHNIPTGYVSKNSANAITETLRKGIPEGQEESAEYIGAIGKVQRWRAQHAQPTEDCFQRLLEFSKRYSDSVVCFRLKRIESILAKLRSHTSNSYMLGSMDDIGGCRLILENMSQVQEAIDFITCNLCVKQGRGVKNRINNPKNSGYRSCHIITVNPGLNRSYRVEVQVRTKLQHLWSTAVESAGTARGLNIKADRSIETIDTEYERQIRVFFMIVSSLFALEEGTTQVPGYERDREELTDELSNLSRLNEILSDLSIAAEGVYIQNDNIENDLPGFSLLKFATGTQYLNVSYFDASQLDEALREYNNCESSSLIETQKTTLFNYDDVVLSYAQNRSQLGLAFPNYSINLSNFIDEIYKYI